MSLSYIFSLTNWITFAIDATKTEDDFRLGRHLCLLQLPRKSILSHLKQPQVSKTHHSSNQAPDPQPFHKPPHLSVVPSSRTLPAEVVTASQISVFDADAAFPLQSQDLSTSLVIHCDSYFMRSPHQAFSRPSKMFFLVCDNSSQARAEIRHSWHNSEQP